MEYRTVQINDISLGETVSFIYEDGRHIYGVVHALTLTTISVKPYLQDIDTFSFSGIQRYIKRDTWGS